LPEAIAYFAYAAVPLPTSKNAENITAASLFMITVSLASCRYCPFPADPARANLIQAILIF